MIDGIRSTSRRNIYIALNELNHYWSPSEVMSVVELWNNGCSTSFIEKIINRLEDEIALLIMSVNSERLIFSPRNHNAMKNTNSVKTDKYYFKRLERFQKTFLKNDYCIFENSTTVDFIWDEDKVLEFDRLWTEGYHIKELRRLLSRRTLLDIAIIAIDRCRKGKIAPREEGLEGMTHGGFTRCSTKTKQSKTA
jgi:hypothetical protein